VSEKIEALVIGAGPAGLMAAEVLANAGHRVVVAEAMPTPARKFLMAGKSGLNLTKDEPSEAFIARFSCGDGTELPGDRRGYLSNEEGGMGPAEVMAWAEGLGIELFTGSTGRVFPRGMKASPLLRAWLARLRARGVELRTGWRWVALDRGFVFNTPAGRQVLEPRVTVLALGGASWPRLGSDAAWVPILTGAGVDLTPFRPANMGFHVAWSAQMWRYLGAAVKGVALVVGDRYSRGEWVISQDGIEGGGIYEVAASIRDGKSAHVDLVPDLDLSEAEARFARPKGKLSLGNWLRRVLRDPVKVALMLEWGRPLPSSPVGWAALAKHLPLRVTAAASMDRAISCAGGIGCDGLTAGLELVVMPNVFAAGEMLDWEAPTGGYLLTGCLATGRRAGLAAAARLSGAEQKR
jgi:uncharacterized flavoprotein (TIGR03862 family)